jgi:hypothetical protein
MSPEAGAVNRGEDQKERNRRIARILVWIVAALAAATFLHGIRW